MTDFPTLFIILACIFLIGLIPLALCALYAACQKRKWCASVCLWDQRERGAAMTTSVEMEELAAAMTHQAPSRPVSALLGAASQRTSHCESSRRTSQCEASDTASDPGMDHINRFLGRSLSDDSRNIYEGESDAGVLHIRRALGLMNKGEVDPGVAHVRRALGMVHDVRDPHGQTQEQQTDPAPRSSPGELVSPQTDMDSSQPDRSTHRGGTGDSGNAAAGAELSDASPASDTYSDGSPVQAGGPQPTTIDRLPSYEEALDILAKINEPEEPPPSYDDAVASSRGVSRSTEV